MIKINLLPFRAARKKENIKRQITISVFCLIILLGGLFFVYQDINGRLKKLKSEESSLVIEKTSYQKTIDEIKRLREKTEDLKRKLKVIKDLQEQKSGPVKLLDQIAEATPRDKLWLNSLSVVDDTIKMSGIAKDNDTVALYMTNLKDAELIGVVELHGTSLTSVGSAKGVSFSITCKLKSPDKKTGKKK